MHRLLTKQLRRTLKLGDPIELSAAATEIASSFRQAEGALADSTHSRILALLERIDGAYAQHDRDATLLQRALDRTSEELLGANERLKRELASRSRAFEALQTALSGLLSASGVKGAVSAQDDIERVAGELAGLATERERLRRVLEEGEGRYRALFEGIIDALLVCEITPDGQLGNFIEVNEVACARLGYTREELLAMSPRDLDDSPHTPLLSQQAERLLAGENIAIEKVHVTKDGRRLPVEVYAKAFSLLGRRASLALVRDISDRVRSEEQLRLWAKVFEASREGIIITDGAERILSANRAVTAITGFEPSELVGRTPRMFSSGMHDRGFFAQMWSAIEAEGHWEGEVWDRRKNGETYPKWLSITTARNHKNEVTNYIGTFVDITERKANEEQIRFLAYHDPLTGLPNRLLVRDRFEQAASRARREGTKIAFLYLDIDRFKTINDSLGHPAGDKLLRAATERLRGCLRETDTISRQGGDEFVIVITNGDSVANLPVIAHKLLERLNEPFNIDGHKVNASSSIGISVYPEDGQDFDTLLRKADTALYQAKEGGRNGYRYFTQQMNVHALDRLSLECRLRSALDYGEFSLHYQPQVVLRTGRVVGVEALLRWNSPDLGSVSPARFIPVAEDSGLILPIGEWALREACRQAQSAGWTDLTMAVNLSAVQFRRGNLAASVSRELTETGLDPRRLELELTESIMIQGTENVLATVKRLKAAGVQLSIDDFGTGYSSLSYLKRFAVDRLKIDQSFVRGLPRSRDDAAIVRAVIQMAHSLNLGVIAEGVETQEQAEFLRDADCDLAQGYLFGRPEPASAHDEWHPCRATPTVAAHLPPGTQVAFLS